MIYTIITIVAFILFVWAGHRFLQSIEDAGDELHELDKRVEDERKKRK